MDNRPIGVFDSGVGGLTVVRELHKILPGEDILYFGDTGRIPYGTRSKETVRTYATQEIRYLMQHDVKALVAACGTISSNLGEKDLRNMGIDLPFIDVVMPATRTACALSSQGKIGVIATSATIRSGAYGKAVRAISPGAQVLGKACPLLVQLVENGLTAFDNQITRLTVEMYLKPLMEEGIDTLILGCTHFPILYDIIGDVLDYKVTLIDNGAEAAKEVESILCRHDLLADAGKTGSSHYWVTDAVEGFVEVAKNFLAEDVGGSVEYVDIRAIDQ